MTDRKKDLENWKSCGNCHLGWVYVDRTETVRRFIGKWVADEVGGQGKFVHPETGKTMKYHAPAGPDDPDFVSAQYQTQDVQMCPCHPKHWSLAS